MMKGNSGIRRMGMAIVTMALLLLSQSCVREFVYEPLEPESKFTLALQVISESADVTRATRADRDDDFEENGTEAENYIDIEHEDMRVFLFTKDGQFLQEIPLKWKESTLSNRLIYNSDEQELFFRSNTDEEKAFIEKIKNEGLCVMVLANGRNLNWDPKPLIFPQTFDQLWKDEVNFNYEYIPGEDFTSWQPSIQTSTPRLIPMFGFKHVDFNQSTAGVNKINATLNMQRSLAKIEVIDNIPVETNVSLSEVTMSNYNQVGRLIPDILENPDWDKEGIQVTKSSLPSSVKPANHTLKLFQDPTNRKKWVAYVPEMALNALYNSEGNLIDQRTHLNLKISAPDFGSFHNAVYPVHFAKYVNRTEPTIPDDSWNHILRNHIYRFSVENVGVNTEIELHVKPWELDEDESWNFTDNITVAQNLVWKAISQDEMSYEEIDKTNGRVLLWIDPDVNKILTGTFIINTPVNGRWIARLTPLDDASPNAMSFVDETGKALSPSHGDPPVCLEVSGIVEKANPAIIRIRPTVFGNDFMSAYKLEFYVENMGVWTKVSLVNDDDRETGSTFDYYTIVRKNNKLQ